MTLFLILMLVFVYVKGIVLGYLYLDASIAGVDRKGHELENAVYIALWPFAVALSILLAVYEIGRYKYKMWRYNRKRKAEDRHRDEAQRSRT